MIRLVYKMLKVKELGVGIEEVEISTCPVEYREKVKEDAPQSPVIDPNVASSSGIVERGDVVRDMIETMLRDPNIPINTILEEEITRDRETTVRVKDIAVKPSTETIAPGTITEPKEMDIIAFTEFTVGSSNVDETKGSLEDVEDSLVDSPEFKLVVRHLLPDPRPTI